MEFALIRIYFYLVAAFAIISNCQCTPFLFHVLLSVFCTPLKSHRQIETSAHNGNREEKTVELSTARKTDLRKMRVHTHLQNILDAFKNWGERKWQRRRRPNLSPLSTFFTFPSFRYANIELKRCENNLIERNVLAVEC